MAERLEDYVDVAERIAKFDERYPDGSLQTISWDVREFGGSLFVVYQAAAYRTPDDTRPGFGMAWEPFPGATPFTRNSELMNAETAAWGRAIVAVGITASRKLASRQEIENRQGEPDPPPPPKPKPKSKAGATEAQRRRVHALIAEKAVTRGELETQLAKYEIPLATGWMDRLTPGRDGTASHLIDWLSELKEPIPERASDVPSDWEG